MRFLRAEFVDTRWWELTPDEWAIGLFTAGFMLLSPLIYWSGLAWLLDEIEERFFNE
jgi:hypothetical protein